MKAPSVRAQLQADLRALPARAAEAFADLFRDRRVDLGTAQTVVAAAAVAEDPADAIAFAAIYPALREAGIPVRATLDLAAAYGRRIDLTGNETYWQTMLFRLRAAQWLEEIGRNPARFDTERYENALPSGWPGYLVRTERRLAMMALRVGFPRGWLCVHGARTGECAVAVVFLNRRRWLVTLGLEDRAPGPTLSIRDIRAGRDRRPTGEERARICARLGVRTPWPTRLKYDLGGTDRLQVQS